MLRSTMMTEKNFYPDGVYILDNVYNLKEVWKSFDPDSSSFDSILPIVKGILLLKWEH